MCRFSALFLSALVILSGIARAEDFAVEIHQLICEANEDNLLTKLNVERSTLAQQDLYFFDDIQFTHLDQNIILRAYIDLDHANGTLDAKIRPIELPLDQNRWDGDRDHLTCEYDTQMVADPRGACRIRRKIDSNEIVSLLSEGEEVKKAFNDTQKNFLQKLTTGVHWEKLKAHGPTASRKAEFNAANLPQVIGLEIWKNGNFYVAEISTRIEKSRLQFGIDQMKHFISDKNLSPCETSLSKLEMLRRYFTGTLNRSN